MKYFLCGVKSGSGKEDFFTYSADGDLAEKIAKGSIVKVPFRGKIIEGVVFSLTEKPNFSTKSIVDSIDGILPEYFCDLAIFLGRSYAATMSQVLKTMLSISVFKKRRDRKLACSKENPISRVDLNDEQRKITDSILACPGKPHLIFGVTGSGKTQIYIELAEKTLGQGKDVLILVPEISLTPQTFERFCSRFPDRTFLYHSYLLETERIKIWNEAASERGKIIIGSRSALFLPFRNLGLIVIDEEHENSYKQDKAPRYLAREVAEFVSAKSGALLVMGSATPSVESFYAAKKRYISITI
jgi:primosomal protein N' (replication factor Y)